jgi:proline-specific peptidase
MEIGSAPPATARAFSGVTRRRAGESDDEADDCGGHVRLRRHGLRIPTRQPVSSRHPGVPISGTHASDEGYVEFRGYRTWYRVVGDLESDRPPLLALHGGPGSTHHYFAPLEQLADERAVVLYDQIGCGRSDRPRNVEWSVDLFRDEVEAVRAQLALDRIHLLGTSWGGMLALEHVLSGAPGIVGLILSSTLANVQQWAAEQRRLRDQLPADVVATLDRLEAADAYDDPEYERAEQVYRDRHFYRGPKPRAELERMRAEKSKDAYRAMVGPNEWTPTGALKDWDVRDRLGQIDVPTLVMRGRYDMCTDAVAATLMAGLRNAREVVLENSSHTPVLEETDRYLDLLRSFIR